MTGILKYFNNARGFGFIAGDDGRDYFFHVSNMEPDSYWTDDKLTFELTEGRKGIEAVNVKRA